MVSFAHDATVIPNTTLSPAAHKRQTSNSSASKAESGKAVGKRQPSTPYPTKGLFTPTNFSFPVKAAAGPFARWRAALKAHTKGGKEIGDVKELKRKPPAIRRRSTYQQVAEHQLDEHDADKELEKVTSPKIEANFEKKYGHGRTGSRSSITWDANKIIRNEAAIA